MYRPFGSLEFYVYEPPSIILYITLRLYKIVIAYYVIVSKRRITSISSSVTYVQNRRVYIIIMYVNTLEVTTDIGTLS